MSKDSNGGFANEAGGMIAVIVTVCFVGSIILKILSAIFTFVGEMIALLLYYFTVGILPCLIAMFVFTGILIISARLFGEIGKRLNSDLSNRLPLKGKSSEEAEKEARFVSRKYDFRAIIFVFPVLSMILYGVIGGPSRVYLPWHEVTIEKNQKGKVLNQTETKEIKWAIDSPKIHNIHEKVKIFFGIDKQEQARLKESGGKAEDSPPYDRADFARILWIALFVATTFLTGFFALLLGNEDAGDAIRTIEAPWVKEVEKVKGQLLDSERNLREAYSAIRARNEEINRLQARDEFLTKREKEKASITDGILTSDKL